MHAHATLFYTRTHTHSFMVALVHSCTRHIRMRRSSGRAGHCHCSDPSGRDRAVVFRVRAGEGVFVCVGGLVFEGVWSDQIPVFFNGQLPLYTVQIGVFLLKKTYTTRSPIPVQAQRGLVGREAKAEQRAPAGLRHPARARLGRQGQQWHVHVRQQTQ